MRSLRVLLDPERANAVLEIAAGHGASGEVLVEAKGRDGRPLVVLLLQITNRCLGDFITSVAEIAPQARFVVTPAGVLPIEPPLDEVAPQVRDVSARSPLELSLSALQSIGSWRGLVLYAVSAGIVASYALIFNIPWLLTAAMLISPMGGPAMVGVVGIATGERRMLWRGAIRFWAAIILLGLAAAAVGGAYGLDFSTSTIELISSLSSWAVLIAVIGGVAGALALVQSDRDSLVTATATGFLVAVSLSPPAGVLGLSVVIGRWDYAAQMSLLLALTFLGILLGGAAVMWGFGVRPGGDRGTGTATVRNVSLIVAGALAAGMVLAQVTGTPTFNKADLSRDAVRLTREVIEAAPGVELLQVDARFTRPRVMPGSEALLVQLWVATPNDGNGAATEEALSSRVHSYLRTRLPDVEPFVDVSVIPARP